MCYKAIALVASDSDQYEEAILAYKQVAMLEPENTSVLNNIGSLFMKLGKYEEAQAVFDDALKKNGSDPVSWNGLGSVYASLDRLDEAIDCLRKAIKFNAGYVNPWIKLGDVLLQKNRYEDALYAFMRTVEMDNKNVHAWSEIGSIYFKAGSFEQAIDAFKKAIILGVDSAVLFSDLADAYSHLGRYSEAMQFYQKAIEREIENKQKALLWNKYGDIFRRISDYENAVTAYEVADRLSISLDETSTAQAEKISQENLVIDEHVSGMNHNIDGGQAMSPVLLETDVPDVQMLAEVVLPQGEVSTFDQVTVLESSVNEQVELERNQPRKSNVTNSYLWVRLGTNYLKVLAVEKAIDAFQKAIDLDPLDGKVYSLLAQAYLNKNEMVEAISYYKKSIDHFDNDKDKAVSLIQLGDVYRQLKQFEDALESFDLAIALDPESNSFLQGLSKIQDDLDKYSFSAEPENNQDKKIETNQDLVLEKEVVLASDRPVNVTNSNDVGDARQPEMITANVDLENANVWNELGNILLKAKSNFEAIAAYKKAIELNPDFGWAYSNLALVYAQEGKREEAVQLYLKSIKLLWGENDKAISWNRLGDVYRQDGNYPLAIEAYQNADKLFQELYAHTTTRSVDIEQLFPHFISQGRWS